MMATMFWDVKGVLLLIIWNMGEQLQLTCTASGPRKMKFECIIKKMTNGAI